MALLNRQLDQRTEGTQAREEYINELARMRHIETSVWTEPNANPRFKGPRGYEKQQVLIFENILLDPDRAVLDEWETTSLDSCNSYRETKGVRDVGYGPGIQPDSKRYRVRRIRGQRTGEVLELGTIEYWLVACEALTPRVMPRFEPVPKDTKLCGPIKPTTFPSNDAKARRLAARGLRKQESEISFKEILAWWSNVKNTPEIYKQ